MKTKSGFTHLALAMMLIAIFLFLNKPVNAQQESPAPEPAYVPSLYFGLGLGINDYGFGACLEAPIIDKLSFYGNAGLGGWGWKLGAGISFYPSKFPDKSSLSIGYSSGAGMKDFETVLTVEPDDVSEKVILNLNRVGTVNLIYSYNFIVGSKGKFSLSAGYAIPVTTNPYEVVTPGITLTQTSMMVMDMMQPGGVILGFKFLFGVD